MCGTTSPIVHRERSCRLWLVHFSEQRRQTWVYWQPGGKLRSWDEAHTRSGSHRAVLCGAGRGSAPLKLKAAPAEWRAPSMRRLALTLLPCALAVLVHLWLAHRPFSTPLDNNAHYGTSLASTRASVSPQASQLFTPNAANFAFTAAVYLNWASVSLCEEQVVNARELKCGYVCVC